MGQALRRASGRIRPSAGSSPSVSKPPPQPKRPAETPSVSGAGAAAPPQDHLGVSDPEDTTVATKDGHGSVLEERDPKYDQMLGFMVGRITSKPGGRAEMGEASIKERYDRPLPKVRSSKVNDSESERPLAPGTLSIEHIHQIILLHQGNSNGQKPMPTKEIADRFQVDITVIEKIVQSISLPQEETNKKSEE